jgi:hypothetical protein
MEHLGPNGLGLSPTRAFQPEEDILNFILLLIQELEFLLHLRDGSHSLAPPRGANT